MRLLPRSWSITKGLWKAEWIDPVITRETGQSRHETRGSNLHLSSHERDSRAVHRALVRVRRGLDTRAVHPA
jgi:hypothetical protein